MPRLEHKFPDDRVFLPEEAHSYGRPNRPSTPVGDVISNYYLCNFKIYSLQFQNIFS